MHIRDKSSEKGQHRDFDATMLVGQLVLGFRIRHAQKIQRPTCPQKAVVRQLKIPFVILMATGISGFNINKIKEKNCLTDQG